MSISGSSMVQVPDSPSKPLANIALPSRPSTRPRSSYTVPSFVEYTIWSNGVLRSMAGNSLTSSLSESMVASWDDATTLIIICAFVSRSPTRRDVWRVVPSR